MPSLLPLLLLAALESHTLDNGVTVLLDPMEGAQNAAIIVHVSVGENGDPDARCGMAHLVEHFVCTAAAGAQPAMTVDDFFGRYNRQANAQTGRDYTVYAGVMPRERVTNEIAWWGERLGNLTIERADFDRELPRVRMELDNMYGGMPALAGANLAQNRADPMRDGHRKGGDMEHLRDAAVDEAMAWYRAHYVAANLTISIAGGFDAEAALAAVTEAFGALPAAQAKVTTREFEPLAGFQVVHRRAIPGAPRAIAARSYRVPDANSPARAPFMIFAARLLQVAQREMANPVPPIQFAPLDNPRVLTVLATVDDPNPDGLEARAAAALDAIVDPALERALADGEGARVAMSLGSVIGAGPVSPMIAFRNPYIVAFRNAQLRHLGIDSEAFANALSTVTAEDYGTLHAGLRRSGDLLVVFD